jgi:hypothetical protein
MLDSELRRTEPPQVWDNTLRTTFRSCPRKMYFFLRGYDYATDVKPPYFTWGAAFQEMLASWYNISEQTVPGTDPHMERAAVAMSVGLRYWDAHGTVGKPPNTRENLEDKFLRYIEEYPDEDWLFTPDSMEVGWQWPLPGTPFYLGGALDGKVTWPGLGGLVLENKTSGVYLSDAFIAQWEYSSQVRQYGWYGSQLMHDFHGVLVNMINKKTPGARSNWTTPEFTRTVVKITPWQIEEFEEDVTKDIEAFLRHWNDWYWPKTCDALSCVGGIGKAPCLFRYVCLSDQPFTDEEPSRFAGISERDGKWEPWSRGKEDGTA